MDVPFRCNIVIFRYTVAYAGYCPCCLGNTDLPETQRIRYFKHLFDWKRHISRYVPEYLTRKAVNGPILCPHPQCVGELRSELALWHHLANAHSTQKPDAGKKRQLLDDEEEGVEVQVETTNNAKTKKRHLRAKLDNRSLDGPAGRQSAAGRCSKPLIGHKFVNISALDYKQTPLALINTAPTLSSSSSCCGTEDNSIWDKHDGYSSSTTTSVSYLDNIFNGALQAERDCYTPGTTPSDTARDPFSDVESWNFDVDGETNPSTITPDVQVLTSTDSSISLSSKDSMVLVDPELQTGISSTEHIQGMAPGTLPVGGGCGDKGTPKPPAIDEDEDIWEVEALLAKWKQGRRVVYLVKWKGFPHEDNTWEKREDINTELVKDFDAAYSELGGNHLGVELLDKRMCHGKAEYLVKWKRRPDTENSWEKELTISSRRIIRSRV